MENPQSYGAAKLKGRVFFKPGAISGRFATKIEVRCKPPHKKTKDSRLGDKDGIKFKINSWKKKII